MKLIFKINGSDFLIEIEPNVIPQLGWKIKRFDKLYTVDGIELDYDLPKEDEKIIIHLKSDSLENVKMLKDQVKVIKVWQQNINSLTLHKIYNLEEKTDSHFSIIDDKGVRKKYKIDNFQFKFS